MKQIFRLITVILLLNQNVVAVAKATDSKLEEVPSNNVSDKNQIQSIEEITADLNAKKAAAEPFNEKDIKVDVESLGLDSIDDKKGDEKKSAALKIPEPVVVEEKSVIIDRPLPATKAVDNSASINIQGKNIQKNQDLSSNKVLSKIQSFVTGKNADSLAPEASEQSKENPKSEVVVLTKKQRIALEKKKVATRIAKEKKAAKAKRLKQLREEYLIKLHNHENDDELLDEDFLVDSALITPKEKSFRWSDRFISYDPPAAPILDQYRGNDNKHIPTIPTNQEKAELMFQAIDNNNVSYFNSAYQHVLNPNLHNPNGETILTYATLFQKYGVMSSILAKGADPDLPNALGHTPLDIAIEMIDMKAAQILIDMNADPHYVNGLGRTYLMHAARVGFLPMVDLLISQGVNINATDNDGITALAIAYKHKKDVIVKFLLKSGAEPWLKKPYNPDQQNLIQELETRWGGKRS